MQMAVSREPCLLARSNKGQVPGSKGGRSWVLVMVVFLHFMQALAAEKRTAEGPTDVIEKAYNLSLQKDRIQSVGILHTALKRESSNSAAAKSLRAAIQEIGGLFFSDKAQQLFELGLSLRKTDPGQATAKISEALRLEPDNIQLLTELARLQVLKGDCAGAADGMAKTRKWDPTDEFVLLVSAQAAVCQGDIPAFAVIRAQAEGKRGPLGRNWLALEVERALKEKSEARAKEALEALKKTDPEYPEIQYWAWKLEPGLGAKRNLAQKYIANCKSLSPGSFRRYMIDTLVCRHVGDAELESEASGSP